MRHQGVKIVYVFMLAVSVLLAFLVLEDLDEEPTLGEMATIWIDDTRGSVSGAETARTVTSFARDHRVSVVRKVRDFRNPDGLLHLYIAAGDPGSAPASWLRWGFSSFGRFIRTETHPFERIGDLDPRGLYQVYGPRGSVEALRAEFAGLGLAGEVLQPAGLGFRISRYVLPPLGPAFLVAALSVVLTVGASVLLSAKGYGVLRLQGMSFLTIARRDLRRLASFWLIAAASITAITLVFLGLYNEFARLGLFAVVAGGLAGVLSLLALIAHLGALALIARSDILRGLKGDVAPGPAMVGAYLVRIIAALLVLVVGGTALVFGQDIMRRQESSKYFAALGEAAYITLPGSRTQDAGEKMAWRVGRWLRLADKRGQVIAVFRWPLEQFGSPGAGVPQGDLLFVNDSFLAEQPILDPSGKRYGPDPRGRVRVIVPEKLREHAGAITQNVPRTINPEDRGGAVRRAGVDQVWARDGQTVFTFGARPRGFNGKGPDGFPLDRSLLRDPVLVVIPNGSLLVTEGNYTARATQEGIIFKNPQDVLAAIGREVPKEHISGMIPVARRAAADYAQSVHKLLISVLNLTAALAVLFITGIGVCVIYVRKNAQAVFAKHINGWSFCAIHRKLFVLDALIAIGLLAWVGWDNWARLTAIKEFTDQGVPPRRTCRRSTGGSWLPQRGWPCWRRPYWSPRSVLPTAASSPNTPPMSDQAGSPTVIAVESLSKSFGRRTLWSDLNLTVAGGRMLAVTGPSGAGKSTLLNCIGLLESPTSGQILYDGVDITQFGKRAARRFRRDVLGYLFQSYALIENATVADNLEIAVTARRDRRSRYRDALERVGLAGREKEKVHHLSGGEQQRVALARLLVKRPSLVLADEPTAALDSANAAMVLDTLREMSDAGCAVIIATHSDYIRGRCDATFEVSASAHDQASQGTR